MVRTTEGRRQSGEELHQSYRANIRCLQEEPNASAVRGFIEEFARTKSGFDRIHFEGLTGPLLIRAVLTGLRAAGWIVKPHFGWGSWYEGTLSTDFEQFQAFRPSTLLNTWKRRLGRRKQVADDAIASNSAPEATMSNATLSRTRAFGRKAGRSQSPIRNSFRNSCDWLLARERYDLAYSSLTMFRRQRSFGSSVKMRPQSSS